MPEDQEKFGVRQARAVGVIAHLVATGTKLTDLATGQRPDPTAKTTLHVHLNLTDLTDLVDDAGTQSPATGSTTAAGHPDRDDNPEPGRTASDRTHHDQTDQTDLADHAGEPRTAGGPTRKVGTVERLGPATLARIKTWLDNSHVTLRPVIDLTTTHTRLAAIGTHDPSAQMREEVILRDAHCVFPGCTQHARACDLDHINPYMPIDQGGPPGQTHPDHLAAMCRRHHRLKTHRTWTYHRDPTRSTGHLHPDRPPPQPLPRHHGRHLRPALRATLRESPPAARRSSPPTFAPAGSRPTSRSAPPRTG